MSSKLFSKLTKKTELKIEDSYFHYTISDITEPVRHQILTNQEKAEKLVQWEILFESYDGGLSQFLADYLNGKNFVQQENKQLRERLRKYEQE